MIEDGFKIEVNARNGTYEFYVDGMIGEREKVVLFDQLANALALDPIERATIATIIGSGGMSKIMGREYGKTTRIDMSAIRNHKKS